MDIRTTEITFNGVPLTSTVILWTKNGIVIQSLHTLRYSGTGKSESHLKMGEKGTLKCNVESADVGGGVRVFHDVSFHEKDQNGCLNFFATQDSGTTVCV